MSHDPVRHISGHEQLRKLRIALAIAQGTKLLSELHYETEATVSHDQTKRVTYLTMLYSRIHRELFHHWRDQVTASHRPGTMVESQKRKLFRKAVARLVMDEDQNPDTAVFDNNGFVISSRDIDRRLADFYQELRMVRPFSYGNKITLDFFMTALGRLPAFNAVYEQGIDFRRLEAADALALHDSNSSLEQLLLAFRHALDPTRTKCLSNEVNGYGKWPENKRFLAGIPFLFHRTQEGRECLVLVNGGLVPLERINEAAFVAEQHFADYPFCAAADIIGYLPGTENLRMPGKTQIDGISVGEDGSAPLFCLDVNILTGLRAQSHTELIELLKETEGDRASLFDIVTVPGLRQKLLSSADDDQRLERSVEIAHQRLSRILKILDEAREAIFEDKIPSKNPVLYMCMGGAGSGKSRVEELATAQCGGNFVTASLDEFRKKSDLYQVLTAANHHSDDYVFVEPFANRLRDQVAGQALTARINLLYDGTAIPYNPRYSRIISQFTKAGFYTHITAVDAFIVKPKGREDELARSSIIDSVKNRFQSTRRALPWVVTVYKHIRSPEAFLNALEDECLDKLSLFANDGMQDQHYLVAENFSFSDDDLRTLYDHQKAGSLAAFSRSLIRNHRESALLALANGDSKKLDLLIDRNHGFTENNVAYLVYSSQSRHKVLVIYNTARMVDFLEKRQLNPNASGPDGLLHKPESLAFDVDPEAPDPAVISLQGTWND